MMRARIILVGFRRTPPLPIAIDLCKSLLGRYGPSFPENLGPVALITRTYKAFYFSAFEPVRGQNFEPIAERFY